MVHLELDDKILFSAVDGVLLFKIWDHFVLALFLSPIACRYSAAWSDFVCPFLSLTACQHSAVWSDFVSPSQFLPFSFHLLPVGNPRLEVFCLPFFFTEGCQFSRIILSGLFPHHLFLTSCDMNVSILLLNYDLCVFHEVINTTSWKTDCESLGWKSSQQQYNS